MMFTQEEKFFIGIVLGLLLPSMAVYFKAVFPDQEASYANLVQLNKRLNTYHGVSCAEKIVESDAVTNREVAAVRRCIDELKKKDLRDEIRRKL